MIKKPQQGMALTTVLLLMAVLGVLVPLFIQWIQKESKDTVAESKKTSSFHLAETGQDRGAWKLRESNAVWTDASNGVPLTNYEGTTEFTDLLPLGTYKIKFTMGPGTGQVTVLSKGRAAGTNEVRAIQAVYNRSIPQPGVSVEGGVGYRPELVVHWGPVVTYNSIDQNPSDFFPRKFSAGRIIGRDVVNDSNNGAMPSEDWITYDYAAYYDLGNPPQFDIASLRQRAIRSTVPLLRKGTGVGPGPQAAGETGSGHYKGDIQILKPTGGGAAARYSLDCSTCVILIDPPDSGSPYGHIAAYPTGAWLDIAALVVTNGNLNFNAGGNAYTASIPSNASKEYQHSSLGSYFTSQGWTDGGTWTIPGGPSDPGCGFHGFIYVGGGEGAGTVGMVTQSAGGGVLSGALYVTGDLSINTLTIYYDQNVLNNIPLLNATINRVSWDEIVTSW